MCRLAAYLGPEIALEQFLLRPPHSLVEQAWSPRELRYGHLNADGFGIGWYAPDDLPAAYVNPMPIWADFNLPYLARTLSSDLWLANVRSATPGHANHIVNTQPFHDDEILFMHNGFIRDFARTVRTQLRQFLDPAIEQDIHGTTDSEYVFALLRHLLADDEELSIEDGLAELYGLLEDWVGGEPALLNLTVSDGERIYASRYALNDEAPSLYYTTDDELFGGGQLVASEPLTDSEFWQPVPDGHLLVLDPDGPADLLAIDRR